MSLDYVIDLYLDLQYVMLADEKEVYTKMHHKHAAEHRQFDLLAVFVFVRDGRAGLARVDAADDLVGDGGIDARLERLAEHGGSP